MSLYDLPISKFKTALSIQCLWSKHITHNPRLSDQGVEGHKVAHLPQMPGYHLVRPDGLGITFIHIGVGPSNPNTITDHLAGPHCWLMLGHCA